MIETLGFPIPQSLSVSFRSPPSASPMDSNPKAHLPVPHSHLGALGAPSDPPRSSNYHVGSTPSPSSVDSLRVSPRTVPLSLRNLSSHETDTASAPISPLKPHGYPLLTIRKSSAYPSSGHFSLSQDAGHGQFVPETSARHHRRQPSTERLWTSSNPRGVAKSRSTEQLFSPHPISTHIRRGGDASLYSSNNSSTDNMHPHDVETALLPGSLELGHAAGDEEICPRHHHRQSVDSIISISCSDRDDNEDSLDSPDHLEGDIETSVPMEIVAPSMLIPLVGRCEEMAELLKHPANEIWTHLAQNTLGHEVWENKCIPLWTKTDRAQMPDAEWLKMSQRLLSQKVCGGICDGRLWHEFCGMVGWDSGDAITMTTVTPEEGDLHDGSLMRSQSRESLKSIEKMSSIAEELEDTTIA